jgi:oxygen-independent coproporphyrinogen-3 oxidase
MTEQFLDAGQDNSPQNSEDDDMHTKPVLEAEIAVTALVAPDPDLLHRFDINGPRYTSYPPANRFTESFGPNEYTVWLKERNVNGAGLGANNLSVYVHVPFCENICYYCACNKVITRQHGRAKAYLDALEREIELVSAQLQGSRLVEQVHLGGGSPTFLSVKEMTRLVAMLRAHFEWSDKADVGIEIDPRTVGPRVQDFDRAVQRAVNRIQTYDQTRLVFEAAREQRFASINLDLIYGLPLQTPATFDQTLDRVLELRPDRVALYHYAHLPERFKPQRRISTLELPSSQDKIAIMIAAATRLGKSGYLHIGMDHFALPTDDLAKAQREGRLHRNFQGYSTHADCDLIGLGVSAIGKIGPTYVQNTSRLDEYYGALEKGILPVERGVLLDREQLLRRAVIMSLMCQSCVSKERIATSFLIDFDSFFVAELEALTEFEDSELVEITETWINVTEKGHYLIRAIAMVFDRQLQQETAARSYSKII